MSSWVGNPGRPPYVIPRGSAGLKKKTDVLGPPDKTNEEITTWSIIILQTLEDGRPELGLVSINVRTYIRVHMWISSS